MVPRLNAKRRNELKMDGQQKGYIQIICLNICVNCKKESPLMFIPHFLLHLH